jgi:putative acetyltransferase
MASATKDLFSIHRVRTPDDLKDTITLFKAYTTWLNIDLTFQDYATELANLPGKYAPPSGELLLARSTSSDEALGCVALRPLPMTGQEGCCEMKRLYVAPAGRGLGLGKQLVERVLTIAKDLGYKECKLDTLGRMKEATGLYKSSGFVECEAYYHNPQDEVVYFSKQL